jgi:hypothetical protein
MAIDITFDGAQTSGFFRSYAEDGFNFTTKAGASPVFPDVLWSGLQLVDQGTGNYLVNQYSQDSLVLKYGGTKTFGALSFDLDGYRNGGFDSSGNVIPTTAPVTFNFVGQKADNSVVQFSFTTDSVVGWQHVTLSADFATGLTSLTWTTNASVEAWGAFDNVAVVVDATDAPAVGNPTLTAAPDAAQVTVNSSTLINVTVNDVDPDGSLGISGFGPDPAHIALGSFTGKSALGADIRFENGQILYTANATSYANLAVGQNASDSFHYALVDGTGATSTGQVIVKIVNPGHAPTLTANTASVNNDQSVTVDVLRNDRDSDPGDTLTLSGFGPNSGAASAYQTTGLSALGSTVSIVGGKLVYNANANVFDSMPAGTTKIDTVYYTVTDSHGASSASSLTITVGTASANGAPIAVADTAAVKNDQTVTINVLANDKDPDTGDTLSLSGFGSTAATANTYQTTGTSALGSTVSIVNGKLVYNANAAVFDALPVGQTKVDTVYYTVTDNHGATSVAAATIKVTNPNHAPVAVADTSAVVNNNSVTINVLANDKDPDTGDTLSLSGFGATAWTADCWQKTGVSALGATVTLKDGQFVYTANANVFDGLTGSQTKVDTFYYTVTDSHGLSSTASVSVTVSASAAAPPQTGSDIDGTKRDDNLVGTSKSEVIRGLAGDDKITGGAGNDTLVGGDGEDTFVFGANFGKDVVFDFQGGHWECDDDHDNRDGGKNNNNGHDNHDRHDDDRDWWDGGNSGYGYGHGYGNDRDDDDRHGNGRGNDRDDDDRHGHGSHDHDWEWVGGDVIKISTSEFRNYADLMARGANTSNGVLFTTADGKDTLLLKGVTLSSLHSGDFLFF